MNLAQAKVAVGETSPIFETPPVIETALGVRFPSIGGFNVVHFGQLLNAFGKDYDHFELKPPLGSVMQFSFDAQEATLNIPMRCWYVNSDNSQLVQIQSDLLIRNWRATEENREYQHYNAIKPLFKRDWEIFCSFLEKHGMKRPSVWQCEVTYVNHLVRGREWRSFEDLSKIFPIWRGLKLGPVLQSVEMAAFNTSFKLPDNAGRIHFNLQPGVTREGNEILQLTVTASGKPEGHENDDLYEWLDYGHLAVVNGFVEFTSAEAHKLWGKK